VNTERSPPAIMKPKPLTLYDAGGDLMTTDGRPL
jgi:hypothetical protein